MKNSDMPAMPIGKKLETKPPRGGDPLGNYYVEANGLTKLEHFAGLAMQGILASPNLNIDLAEKLIAEAAIVQAKALLEELEKQK